MRAAAVVVSVLCAGLLAGCGRSPAPPAVKPGKAATEPAKSKGVIGVSVMTLVNPFFKVIGDTVAEEGKKHGYEVIVTSGDNKVALQHDQIKDFIVKRVSAIVLCPCDSKAIGPAIQEANAAGIPVFTADLACQDPAAKVVCHVATDNLAGGKEAGKAMIEALGEAGGKILVLDFKPAESCQLRVQGFKEVIGAHNKDRAKGRIEIVAELDGGGHRDKGYKSTQDALQSHPDIAGVFAINDPSAMGARAALEEARKADQVKIIGFDGQPEGKQFIKEGKIYADPVQFPDEIARKTVQMIVKHFEGEEVPREVLIPTPLYRKADGEKDPSLK